jgi:hypothetical protein
MMHSGREGRTTDISKDQGGVPAALALEIAGAAYGTRWQPWILPTREARLLRCLRPLAR